MQRTARIACLAFAFTLAACGGAKPAPEAREQNANLPAPEAARGAVTGMPDAPGPGAIGAPPAAPSTVADANATDMALPPDAQGIAVGERNPSAPASNGNAAEPGPDDAAQLLRDYYAAIDARDYGRAWHLWADDGAASRQSLRQFADGFADTRQVSVDLGAPGDEGAGAGQRYIEIPATVTAIHVDGSRHRYTGSYVLHRAVVDGATAEQRAWRIQRADLREATP